MQIKSLRRKTIGKLNEIYGRESKRKSLLYTPEARDLLRKNNQIITNFLDARQRILAGEENVSVGNLTLQRLKRRGSVFSELYKANIAGKCFFIKEQREGNQGERFDPKLDLASVQLKTLHSARQLLEKIPGVKVANYHLAWANGSNSFLLTDFYEGESVEVSYYPSEHYLCQGAGEKIDARVKAIKKAANGKFLDVNYSNMMYLPKQDVVLVFDLRPTF